MKSEVFEDAKHKATQVRAKNPRPVVKPVYLDNVNVTAGPAEIPLEIHYDIRGQITSDNVTSLAKKVMIENKPTEYYVKFATAGPNVGRMLNPWGLTYNEGDIVREEREMGRKRYEFRRVHEEIFDSYLTFLKTRNEAYILKAERSVNQHAF